LTSGAAKNVRFSRIKFEKSIFFCVGFARFENTVEVKTTNKVSFPYS
jgi:hypothetical protein